MPIRRAADPLTVQHVWDGIRLSIFHHQMADVKRIVKCIQRIQNCTYSQAELYIQQTVQDGLIVALQKLTGKGEEIESFKIPNQEMPESDGKDWYCFECHLAGNVNECTKCYRVYHTECILNGRRRFETFKKVNISNSDQYLITLIPTTPTTTNNVDDDKKLLNDDSKPILNNNELNQNNKMKYIYNEELCSICNISNINNDYNLEKSEINYLLKFVLHRIESWLPNIITHTMAKESKPEWLTDTELEWRANQLFFQQRDMSMIETNLNNQFYEHIYEFLADVFTIQHNVAIFHGVESQEYAASVLLLRDCLHDLGELKNCVDCYRHSNEKINSKWFCLPCRIPHVLVWAKQKGYPYWPAKVIKETDTHFDVRFFGGKYERSLLGKSCIKPISVPKDTLQIKSSSAFNKAVEELKYHQKLLNDPNQVKKIIESSKSKRAAATTTKRKNSINNKNNSNNNLNLSNGDNKNDLLLLFANNLSETKSKNDNKKRKLSNLTETVPTTTDTDIKPNIDDKNDTNLTTATIKYEDDNEMCPFRENFSTSSIDCDSAYEQVTSSTENYRNNPDNNHLNNTDNDMQQLEHPYRDSVERMRRGLESLTEKNVIIKYAMDCMQNEIDRIVNDNNEQLKRIFESHRAQISETKKKQWCYNCEQDAIYHCCWNTAYCSQDCQQEHWQAEHKKVCRRKR